MKTYDLIIVGAGIAGKATSLRLAQLGLKILHLAPSFEVGFQGHDSAVWDSRIYALSVSSKNLLEQMHVWSALDASRIQVVSDMRVFGDSGHADDEIHFSAFSATVPQLSWIVESGHIEKTLDAAIQFQGLIERITDKVIDVVSNNEGVTVTTESGLNVCGKLLLAADGAHSFVREKLQIETAQNAYDQTAVVANFQAEKHHQGTACQWFLPGGEILALLPLPDKKLSMVWSASTEHAERLKKLSPESLCAELIRVAHGQVLERTGQLRMLTAQQGFSLRRMKAKRLIAPEARPRVVLIGDAAHVMHPLAGQGLNLGLRDVASLADILGSKEEFRAFDDPVLLRRFERARHGDTDALLFTTDRLQKLFANEAGHMKTIRNLGMKLVNRSHFLKRQLIKQALA
jgi:ubiquinone biosynthesis UbiH/UbiF/VisC/COQ6 family hydroxylase